MENKWISVKDMLPDIGVPVLTIWHPIDWEERPFHKELVIAELSTVDKYGNTIDNPRYMFSNGVYYEIERFFTHWMPIPKPPEDNNE